MTVALLDPLVLPAPPDQLAPPALLVAQLALLAALARLEVLAPRVQQGMLV